MLKLKVQTVEGFDEATEKFVGMEFFELELEHSLVSLSKWEMFFEKPFLSNEKKTPEETLYYIKCMELTGGVPDEIWSKLTEANVEEINAYINAKMSGTTIFEPKNNGRSETISAELIYYWMSALQIDWQAQNWHLNRLMTLIRIANIKNQPQKKMSARETAQRMAELNQKRLAENGGQG